ncbi:unnamed protein product [Ilex paraguariensis]|uniref:Uncharacterized protein n=1 Tax=Ilex paraguariensis TaxID=185542 RepID=A0ABC8R2B4_9AQUA
MASSKNGVENVINEVHSCIKIANPILNSRESASNDELPTSWEALSEDRVKEATINPELVNVTGKNVAKKTQMIGNLNTNVGTTPNSTTGSSDHVSQEPSRLAEENELLNNLLKLYQRSEIRDYLQSTHKTRAQCGFNGCGRANIRGRGRQGGQTGSLRKAQPLRKLPRAMAVGNPPIVMSKQMHKKCGTPKGSPRCLY